MSEISKDLALKALAKLDEYSGRDGRAKFRLIVGGGASMVLAHGFPGKTADIDSMPNIDFHELSEIVLKIATEMQIPADWLNPYYTAYSHYLPKDYNTRLISVYSGQNLLVHCLGIEDMLIMKLMAGRGKDMRHIKFLFHKKPNLKIVEKRIEELKNFAKEEAENALDLLDNLIDESNI